MNDDFNAVRITVVANSNNPHGVAVVPLDGGVPLATNENGQMGVVTPSGVIYVCP